MGHIKNKTISSNTCKTKQKEDGCSFKKSLNSFGKSTISNKFRNFHVNSPVYRQILKSSGTQTPFISLDDSIGIISNNEENCSVCAPEFIRIFKMIKSMTSHTIDTSTQPLPKTPSTEDEFKIYKLYSNIVFSDKHNPLMLFNNDLLNIINQEFHKKDTNLVSVGVQKCFSKESLLCSKCSFALKNKTKAYHHNMKEQHKVIQKILINSLLSNKRQINGKILHNKKEKFLKDINSPQSSSKSKTKEESTDHKCESSWDNFIQPFFKNKSKVKSVSTTKNLIKSFGLIQTKLLRGDAILDNVKLRKYDKYGKLVKDCDQDYTNSCSSGTTSNKIPKIKSEKNENKTFANKNMNVSVEMKKKTPKLGMGDNTRKKIINLTPKPNIDPIRYPKIVNPLSVIIPIEQNLNKRKLKRRKYVPKSRDSTLKPKTGSDVMKSDTKSVSGDKSVKSTPSPTIKKTQVLPLNVIHKKRNTKNSKIGKDNNSKNSQIGNNSNTKDKESEQQLDKRITPYISNTKLQNNIIIEKIESDNYNKNINWRTDIRKSRPRSAGRKVESVKSPTLNNHITENNIYRNLALRVAASPYERKIYRSGQIQIKPEIKMARYGKYINEVLDGRDIIAKSSQIIDRRKNKRSLKSTKN